MIIKTFENFNSLVKKEDHYRKGPITFSEDEINFRNICDDITKKDFTEEDVITLNRISEYPNFYNIVHDWLKNEFRIFKKYSLLDIEDRLIEFSDKLLKWNSKIMFSLSRKNTSIGISNSKLNDEDYFYTILKYVIKDIAYACSSYQRMTVDQYLSETKASIYFNFNKHGSSHESYNFEYVEKLILEFERRMKNIYGLSITHGDSSLETRELRKYNTNIDVYDYSFTMNLRRR